MINTFFDKANKINLLLSHIFSLIKKTICRILNYFHHNSVCEVYKQGETSGVYTQTNMKMLIIL